MLRRKPQPEPTLTKEELQEQVHALAQEYINGYVSMLTTSVATIADEVTQLQKKLKEPELEEIKKQLKTLTTMVENTNEGLGKFKTDHAKTVGEIHERLLTVEGEHSGSLGELEHRVDDLEKEVGW